MEATLTGDQANELRETVRAKYAASALRVVNHPEACCGDVGVSSCCGATADAPCCDSTSSADPITGDLYTPDDAAAIPATALLASLGCGNPTALAELSAGETVLDP